MSRISSGGFAKRITMFLPNKKDSIHKAWLYRVLRKIADNNFLVSVLYFKGGTCAAMQGFLDRFSVDLNFDFTGEKKQILKVKKNLENIFIDLGLEIKDQSNDALQYFLKYPAKTPKRNTIKIDTFFPPLAGNKYEAVRLPDIDRIVYSQTIETMFANKLIALIDRFKKGNAIAARDLYDVHHFFLQGYDYDKDIIENYADKSILDFITELYDFVNKKISQRMIDQDLNFLIAPEKFQKIRKILIPETLLFLGDEIKRLKSHI